MFFQPTAEKAMKIVIPGMGLLSDDEIELFEKTQHSIWGDTKYPRRH